MARGRCSVAWHAVIAGGLPESEPAVDARQAVRRELPRDGRDGNLASCPRQGWGPRSTDRGHFLPLKGLWITTKTAENDKIIQKPPYYYKTYNRGYYDLISILFC